LAGTPKDVLAIVASSGTKFALLTSIKMRRTWQRACSDDQVLSD
jgi:hypothetical protein